MDPFASFGAPSVPVTAGPQGRVLFDYASQQPNQISLKKGQVIKIIGNVGAPGGWTKGEEVGTGKTGYFPSDYIEVVAVVAPMAVPIAAPIVPPKPTVS